MLKEIVVCDKCGISKELHDHSVYWKRISMTLNNEHPLQRVDLCPECMLHFFSTVWTLLEGEKLVKSWLKGELNEQ